MYIFLVSIAYFLTTSIFCQSQEEILSDLRNESVSSSKDQSSPRDFYLEKLKSIYLAMGHALEGKEDRRAIDEANQMEAVGISSTKLKIRGYAELNEEQSLYLKIRRLRGEAYFNLREFKDALPDSKFIVESHPRSVVFDYTRYAVSLYYSGEANVAKKILRQAKLKFKNENDQSILAKTDRLLFPE